jgi:hypothetical protein
VQTETSGRKSREGQEGDREGDLDGREGRLRDSSGWWMVGGGSEIGAGRSRRDRAEARAGLLGFGGLTDGQLRGEREEREQHDRSRVLMDGRGKRAAARAQMRADLCGGVEHWRRNGGEGRGGRVRRWSRVLESGVLVERVASVRTG